MPPRKAAALIACVLASFSCASPSTPGLDGGTDDRPATTHDARADDGAESGDFDGGTDAGLDGRDGGEPEGGLDVVTDVGFDARFDTGRDARPDARPDARTDGGSRAMHLGARTRSTSNTSPAQLRADFANAQPVIGPLTVTRAFQNTLPVDQSERITPSGDIETGFGAIVPLPEVAEFQRWYSLVRTRGKPLLVTEYGRGTVGAGEVASTPSRRAAVIAQDHAWLGAAGFTVWSIWYSDFGPDGRSWRFTDRASLDAWTTATANP